MRCHNRSQSITSFVKLAALRMARVCNRFSEYSRRGRRPSLRWGGISTYLLSGSAEPGLAETVAAPEGAVQAAPFGGAAPAADAPSVASVPKYFSDTPVLCVSC